MLSPRALPKTLARLIQSAQPERTREKVERLNAGAVLDRVQAHADLNDKLPTAVGTGGQQDQTQKMPAPRTRGGLLFFGSQPVTV